MIYHVVINQHTSFEVEATTTVEAIAIALDTYITDLDELPDNCDFDTTTQSICVCAELAGDLVVAPIP